MKHSIRLGIAAAVSLIVVTAACSNDRSSSTKPGASDPIKIMTLGVFDAPVIGFKLPELPAGAQARVDAINAAGGIDGRDIELLVCNTKADSNEAAVCAREAVEEGVVAVVKMSVLPTDDPSVWPVLESAGIPVIGTASDQPGTSGSPVAFGLTNDFATNTGGGSLLGAAGASKVSVMVPSQARTAESDEAYGRAITDSGVELGAVVYLDDQAVDIAPFAAQAAEGGTNGVYTLVPDGNAVDGTLQAFEAQNYPGIYGFPAMAMSGETIKQLGDRAEGLHALSTVAYLDSDAPGVKLFKEDMAKYAPDMALDEYSLTAWLATWTFEKVAADLPNITAETVLDAMGKVDGLDMGGITPPLTTVDGGVKIPGQPKVTRIFNAEVSYGVVRDGVLQPLDSADPFDNPYAK